MWYGKGNCGPVLGTDRSVSGYGFVHNTKRDR